MVRRVPLPKRPLRAHALPNSLVPSVRKALTNVHRRHARTALRVSVTGGRMRVRVRVDSRGVRVMLTLADVCHRRVKTEQPALAPRVGRSTCCAETFYYVYLYLLCLGGAYSCACASGFTGVDCMDAPPFISVWETITDSSTITLPLMDTGSYNAIVDWGDSSATDVITAHDSPLRTHTFALAGTYTITVSID